MLKNITKPTIWLAAMVAVTLLSLNGCEKATHEDQPGEQYLPVKITYAKSGSINTGTITYKYLRNTGILSELEHKFPIPSESSSPQIIYKHVITYNDADEPVKQETFINGVLSYRQVYTLNSEGDPIRVEFVDTKTGQPSAPDYHLIEYNTNRQVTSDKLVSYGIINDKPEYSFTKKYIYAQNGNISKFTDVYGRFYTVDYDNNIGAFKFAKNLHLFFSGHDSYLGIELFLKHNNAVKIARTDPDPLDAYTYTYDYNQDKYPARFDANSFYYKEQSYIADIEYKKK